MVRAWLRRWLPAEVIVALLALVVCLMLAANGSADSAGAAERAPTAGIQHVRTKTLHMKVDSTAVPVAEVGLRSGGRARSYLLLAPTTIRGAAPLVILLHGTDISAEDEMQRTGFAALAERDGFYLAAPQSIGVTWNSNDGCCGVAVADHINDTAFVRGVLTSVRRSEDVDPRRIYIVGYSNGGKLSYAVACSLPGVFAGQATYGAGPQKPCHDSAPQSAFVGYGANDVREPPAGKPYNSRGLHQPAALTVSQLLTRDTCSRAPTVSVVGPATIDSYGACRDGTHVQYVVWAHQTHTFPVAPAVPAAATAATLMWDFLSAQTAPAAT